MTRSSGIQAPKVGLKKKEQEVLPPVPEPVVEPVKVSKIPKFGAKAPVVAKEAVTEKTKTPKKEVVAPIPVAETKKTPAKPVAVAANATPAKPTPAKAVAAQPTPAKTPAKPVVAAASGKTPAKTPVAPVAVAPVSAKKAVSAVKSAQKKVVVPESESEEEEEEDEEVYDSEDGLEGDSEEEDEEDLDIKESGEDDVEDSEDEEDTDEDSGFEVQSSSDEEEGDDNDDDNSEASPMDSIDAEDDDEEASDVDEESKLRNVEVQKRFWNVGTDRATDIEMARKTGELALQQYMHVDDLSSDDEEDEQGNTIGRVPLHWYDAFDHIGYSVDGKKIAKRPGQDRIDMAIQNRDDPMAMRRIYDMYNDREVVLTERELELIRRIQNNAFAHPEFNDTPDYVDYFTHEKEIMPLSAAPEPKSRFVPSKWEMMKVMKIAKAIKEGRYKVGADQNKDDDKKDTYLIWNDAEDEVLAESRRYKFHLPAPKMPLPGHAESYNPPPEYLMTEAEIQQYNELDPEDRPANFIPKKHDCLRHVAGYENFIKERFERCLDLYLCPRKLKKRLNIDPETLVPKLPHPRELKPFPNMLCLQFIGHTKGVRCITVSTDGQYLVSGSDDGSVRLWEVDSCLCKYVWELGHGPVTSVSWNPDPSHQLVAAVTGNCVVLISTGTGDADSLDVTESQLSSVLEMAKTGTKNVETNKTNAGDDDVSDDEEDNTQAKKVSNGKTDVRWKLRKDVVSVGSRGAKVGPRVELVLDHPVSNANWHHKGDYFVALCPQAGAGAVSVHQLSKGKSQFPFTKSPGAVQTVSFHPFLPCLIVVTQQHVKLYHLVEQKLVKKLLSGCKWLSSADIHTSGDHIIVGSYDRRVVWFDLDLSSTPYKTLKFHERAVRDVKFHKRYPLMASASDDGSVHIFHSMVYNDLTRNPMIVPLKVLKGHGVIGDVGVTAILFHPRQPWIFSAGADGIINLYQDL